MTCLNCVTLQIFIHEIVFKFYIIITCLVCIFWLDIYFVSPLFLLFDDVKKGRKCRYVLVLWHFTGYPIANQRGRYTRQGELSLHINVNMIWFVIIKKGEIVKKISFLVTWLGFDDYKTTSQKEESLWRLMDQDEEQALRT